MRSLLSIVLLLLHSALVYALHKSDVGVVDWYKKLVGVPLVQHAATAPRFYHVGGKDFILTATTSNVLAALGTEDGQVAWRYIFEAEDRIAGYYAQGNVVATLSGPGGAVLRTFDMQTGVLLLEKLLHPPELGHLAEPHVLGKDIIFAGENATDLYVLTNGHTLSRIDSSTGEVQWTFSMPDASSLVINSKLALTPTAIYLVGIAKSTASYTLHVTSLVPETGEFIHTANIPSSIRDPMTDFLIVSQGHSNNTRVVWIEQGSLKHVPLVPQLKAKPVTVKHAEFQQIIDVGLVGHGYMLAVKKDETGRVMRLVEDGIKGVFEFNTAPYDGSVYAGSLDDNAHPYIARVYWANQFGRAAIEMWSGSPNLQLSYFPFDTSNHGIFGHIAMSVYGSPKAQSESETEPDLDPRLLLSTSAGSVQFFQQAKMKWNRDEALTTTMVSEFVELPPTKAIVGNHDGESFTGRVVRHVGDLQNLPTYVVHWAQRFMSGEPSARIAVKASSASGKPTRDEFGFRQIIVAATMFGKIYGIDSTNGEVVWSRLLGLGWAAEIGGRVIPVKILTLNGEAVGDEGKGTRSDVVLVAQRRADNALVDTVIFHIDAITGEDATGKVTRGDVFEGIDVVQGPIVESYLLEHDDQKVIIFLDEFLQVYTYPDTSEAFAFVKSLLPSLYFPLRTTSNTPEGTTQRRLVGHQIALDDVLSKDRPVAYPVWTLSLPEGEDITGLISPNRGSPIASFGKVLANRTTLYKYLNPHMTVILTARRGSGVGSAVVDGGNNATTMGTACGLYVVNNVKGSIIYRASLPAPKLGGKCDVKAALTENWLVYHYYDPDEGAVDETRGWKMVSVELYEGYGLDEKTKSSELSSYSNSTTHVTAYEDAFMFPHAVTAITMTKTKFGISTKDVIVATKSNKVQSLSRRLLDPRRPRTKPTNQELEEGLVQYDPVIHDNPKAVLSHEYDVANVGRIMTAPSLLESTSLVFAFGLDMFLTRTSPSGVFDLLSENFNKKQLVLIVIALLTGIVITRPMVRRKKLRERWYF